MGKEFDISMQVGDASLRLVSQGELTDGTMRKILRAVEAGLRVFAVVIIDVQGATEKTAGIYANLEEGLRKIISERKQVLIEVDCKGPRKKYSLLKDQPSSGQGL